MDAFTRFVAIVESAKEDADKFYASENYQAGKRLRAKLLEADKLCREAREELRFKRDQIREERGIKY